MNPEGQVDYNALHARKKASNQKRFTTIQEKKMIKKIGIGIMMVCLGILAVSILSGCNTMKGVGEDIGAGGEAIERGSGR